MSEAETNPMRADLDAAGFEALYDEHAGALYGYLLRRCRNEDEAQDLTQEAFVEAWRTRDRFRGECLPKTWLFSIAINLMRKRWSRRKPVLMEELPDPGTPMSHSPEVAAAMSELERDLDAALARLPEDQRIAFEMVRFEDMPYAEAAAVIGCTENAVRMRLHKAMVALRDMLANHGEG